MSRRLWIPLVTGIRCLLSDGPAHAKPSCSGRLSCIPDTSWTRLDSGAVGVTMALHKARPPVHPGGGLFCRRPAARCNEKSTARQVANLPHVEVFCLNLNSKDGGNRSLGAN